MKRIGIHSGNDIKNVETVTEAVGDLEALYGKHTLKSLSKKTDENEVINNVRLLNKKMLRLHVLMV